MVSKIKKKLRTVFGLRPRQSKHLLLGKHSLDKGIRITVRGNFSEVSNATCRLIVGDESVVTGNFIFEKGIGDVSIGNRTFIGGSDFICTSQIDIGDDVLISWGCTFSDTNAHSLDFNRRSNDVQEWARGIKENRIGYYKNWEDVVSRPIKIESGAWIGFKCIILKGVTIGAHAVVGAGSVVTRDVPAGTVVAGNPARIIRRNLL